MPSSLPIAPETDRSPTRPPRLVAIAQRGIGRSAGISLLFAGLVQYRSGNALILHRWSPTYAATLGVVLACAIALVIRAFRTTPAEADHGAMAEVLAFDGAVLAWGLAYFVAAIDSNVAAGALLDGNVIGSTVPLSVALNYVALALLLVAVGASARRLSGTLQHVALMAIAVLTAFVAGEGWVRGRALVAPTTQGFPTHTSELWVRRHVHRNELGFRDREHARTPATGTRRLLLVGDSFAFGMGIDRIDDRFGELLGQALGKRTGTRWETITAAQPDRHTLEELDMLASMLPYHPDVVVLLYVFNDIDYLRPVTPRAAGITGGGGIWNRLRPGHVAFVNSFLFQELYVRLRGIASVLQAERLRQEDAYLDERMLARHLLDVAALTRLAESTGAVALLVPFDVGVSTDDGVRKRYDRFVTAARAAGIRVARLDTAFAGHTFRELTLNSLDRHPSRLANQLAADAVAPDIVRLLVHGGRAPGA